MRAGTAAYGAPMKRLRLAVVSAVLLALAPAASASAAAPAFRGSPDRFGAPLLLALGDSVAAGVGATAPKVTGYPEQVLAQLREGYSTTADKGVPGRTSPLEIRNLAVPGATTTTLAAQLLTALALIEQRRDDLDPKNDVEVVTLTIGGNDVFTPVVASCVLTPTPTTCQRVTDTQLQLVRTNLTAALSALTAAAGPRAEVVVTTYYNPIGSCFVTALNPAAPRIADVVLEGGTFGAVLTVQAGLNDVIREVAAATGAQVADLSGQLSAGQYVGGADCLHPNPSGHVRIADVVTATLEG